MTEQELIDLKERIVLLAVVGIPEDKAFLPAMFTPAERDYLLDAINKAAHPLLRLDPVSGDVAAVTEEWACGHVAGAVCAQCHAELIRRANGLAAENTDLREELIEHKRALRLAEKG